MGVICSLGHHLDEFWRNILAGKSGVSFLEGVDVSRQSVHIGAQVRDFTLDEELLEGKNQARYDRFIHFALHATQGALNHAGLRIGKDYPAHRVGAIMGVGMGGFPHIEKNYDAFLKRGHRGISPFFIPSIIPNMTTGLMSLAFAFRGPSFAVSSACASSGHALGLASREIALGLQDAMISGGAEGVLSQLSYGGFTNMKALAKGRDAPAKASRPFDKQRNGFVMAEGAGVLILENYEKAKARGATILAEFLGQGSGCDAHHVTAPHPEGEGAARCMEDALSDAGISAGAIDYVNAHATSTPLGDTCEIKAIKKVFGRDAKNMSVSSTKSMTGHLLGAASGVESVICVKALETGTLPPTINLDNLDPNCDGVSHVVGKAKKASIEYALNNSFGFGGTNSSLIFKKGP